MHKLYWNILSFLIGLLLGSLNLVVLFFLVKKVFYLKEDLSRKSKISAALGLGLKFLVILLAFYLVIVILKLDVLYLLAGFTVSMFLMVFLVKRSKD